MSTRATETTVTFKRSFSLKSLDGPQPPGTYRLVVDEDEVPGISFLAYRRTATRLETPAISIRGRPVQSHIVDRAELDAALEADGNASPGS